MGPTLSTPSLLCGALTAESILLLSLQAGAAGGLQWVQKRALLATNSVPLSACETRRKTMVKGNWERRVERAAKQKAAKRDAAAAKAKGQYAVSKGWH